MTKAEIRRQRKAASALRRYRNRRDRFWSLGLTYNGAPRQLQHHADLVDASSAPLRGHARRNAYRRKVRRALADQGMTQNGSVRRRREYPQFAHLPRPERLNAIKRLHTVERRAAGFSSRGTPLTRTFGRNSARSLKAVQWDFFRAQMGDLTSPEILSDLKRDAA